MKITRVDRADNGEKRIDTHRVAQLAVPKLTQLAGGEVQCSVKIIDSFFVKFSSAGAGAAEPYSGNFAPTAAACAVTRLT